MMKYADAIVKCFASALAIIAATLLSVPLFGFGMSALARGRRPVTAAP